MFPLVSNGISSQSSSLAVPHLNTAPPFSTPGCAVCASGAPISNHDRPRSLCWATLNPNIDPSGPRCLMQFLTSTLKPNTVLQHNAVNSRVDKGRDDGGVISICYALLVVIIYTRLSFEPLQNVSEENDRSGLDETSGLHFSRVYKYGRAYCRPTRVKND